MMAVRTEAGFDVEGAILESAAPLNRFRRLRKIVVAEDVIVHAVPVVFHPGCIDMQVHEAPMWSSRRTGTNTLAVVLGCASGSASVRCKILMIRSPATLEIKVL